MVKIRQFNNAQLRKSQPQQKQVNVNNVKEAGTLFNNNESVTVTTNNHVHYHQAPLMTPEQVQDQVKDQVKDQIQAMLGGQAVGQIRDQAQSFENRVDAVETRVHMLEDTPPALAQMRAAVGELSEEECRMILAHRTL